jgi:hypothetical protein
VPSTIDKIYALAVGTGGANPISSKIKADCVAPVSGGFVVNGPRQTVPGDGDAGVHWADAQEIRSKALNKPIRNFFIFIVLSEAKLV